MNSINSNDLSTQNIHLVPAVQFRAKSSEEKGISKLSHAKSHSQIPAALTLEQPTPESSKLEKASPRSKRPRKKSVTENIAKDLKHSESRKISADKSRILENHKNHFQAALSPKFISKKKINNFEFGADICNNSYNHLEGKEKFKTSNKKQTKDLKKELYSRDNEENNQERKGSKKSYKIVRDDFKLIKTKKTKQELPPLPNHSRRVNQNLCPSDSDRKKLRATRENLKYKSAEKTITKGSKKNTVKNGILSANTNSTKKLTRNYSVYSEKRVKFSDDTRFEQSESSESEEVKNRNEVLNETTQDQQLIHSSSCNTDSDEWISIFNFKNSDFTSDFVEEFKQKINKSNEKLKKLVEKPPKSESSLIYDKQDSTPSEEKLTQDRNESIDSSKAKSSNPKESLQSFLHLTQLSYLKPEVSESHLDSSKSSKLSSSIRGAETAKNIRKNPKYKTKS